MNLSQNALNVLKKRYLRRDGDKLLEEPEEMFRRVAHNITQAEKKYDNNISPEKLQQMEDVFYTMMFNLEFLPNSPTLMNAGRDLQQLSACFVLPIEDSMEGIFETIKHSALIHKSGGGTGFSFSRLRPRNDNVQTTGGVASGPISFMRVFNAATEAVKQGGTRRGANMGILRVDHPDIIDFITSKQNTTEFTNFNISVAITEKFMEAVQKDEEYDLMNPRTKEPFKKLRAREIFDLIVENAWKTGEPGIIFIDRINKDNPTPELGEIESTNPCGEQPLLPYESCNLGSINLAKMVKQGDGNVSIVDYDNLRKTIHNAVRFLDNVIEMSAFPLPQIEKMTRSNRKIGLGVMGFADMLIQLKVPYNSEEALNLAGEIMGFIEKESKNASIDLAKERGSFQNFQLSVYNKNDTPMRNATTTTIAPTGTLSIIANCSSGVEPLYAISYIRTCLDNTKMIEVNSYFEKIAKERGFWDNGLMEKIAEKGSIHEMQEIPEDIQKIFITAHDITPIGHLKMQAMFQKNTDNAVSKTVNFSKNATIDDVKEVFILAYREGCKGVTVYRDGSRENQVLSTKKNAEQQKTDAGKIIPRPRPSVTIGRTQKIGTGCGSLYVTINEDEKGLCEVFAQMGKSGGCAASQSEATSRLVSLALRSGVDIDSILKQLKGIRCPSPFWDNGNMVLSCPDAIAKAIERYFANGEPSTKKNGNGNGNGGIKTRTKDLAGMCPDCSNVLEYVEDCVLCRFCGYSKCG
ncbi:MAG: vitamin B12-dependent ribonucleotide reductase [Candidatus Firestonebacteria bacterium]